MYFFMIVRVYDMKLGWGGMVGNDGPQWGD
jgi:hypothetical protein